MNPPKHASKIRMIFSYSEQKKRQEKKEEEKEREKGKKREKGDILHLFLLWF